MRAIAKYQIRTVKATEAVPQLLQSVFIQGKQFMFEVDTGAGDNFCSEDVWCDLGKPSLSPDTGRYEVASGQPLPTLGIFSTVVTLQGEESSGGKTVEFTVTTVPQLNLLGRDAIVRLQVNISALMDLSPRVDKVDTSTIRPIFSDLKPDQALQKACKHLCQEFPDLFKPELGCLKDFQLEVKFNQMQNPFSANHEWSHLPSRKTSVKPMMLELPEGCGYLLSLMTMELLWFLFGRQVYLVSRQNCGYVAIIQLV